MGLPPPKLRDLREWIKDNPTADIDLTKVWEIGVPAKKSLTWSIALSVLFSESTASESFPELVKKLTGEESETKEIKGKKKLSLTKIDEDTIKKKLRSFNPFKNRHNFFHWQEISEIIRIFDLRLKRYANSKKPGNVQWNDDWKLKAASRFLDCKIAVYFPKTKEFIAYQEMSQTSHASIVLFQYKDQQHGARRDPLNIFNFAMNVKYAHDLKLDALKHFLKKAKIDSLSINKIIELMKTPESHGAAFLPTIIESICTNILPDIYRSPYIAFKLSQAGFETDPIARVTGKPSPLCYVLLNNTDPEYLKILYDYASNCRSLFDRSVRRADDTVLDNLRRIKSVIESDIAILNRSNFDRHSKERALHVLQQINKFIDYQSKLAEDLTNLKYKVNNKSIKNYDYRKEVIQVIVEHYLNFIFYEKKSKDILEQLNDFVSFTEYYDFTDNFFYISFFDNFFKLKLWFGLTEERVLSSDIEGKMCLAIKSNKYFPRFVPSNTSKVQFESINHERNILRHIPLYHRNVVESEVESLLEMLKKSKEAEIRKRLATGSHSYPEIIDEVIIARLNKYLEAVQETSPGNDGMTTVLVIERAMQVIGESIKPPSSMGSIVSFLLRSCLPTKLQEEFIKIRNDLSKYRCNSVYGKLKIEKDTTFFEEIKKEFKEIKDAFEIVNFTQFLRLEESVMSECLNQLITNMERNAYEKFMREYKLHLNRRTLDYDNHHQSCIELLLDSLSDFQEQSKKRHPKLELQTLYFFGQLKSIEYLVEFIGKNKNEKYLDNLLSEVQNFFKINKIKCDDEIEELINTDLLLKDMKSKGKNLNEMITKSPEMKKLVEKQLNELQQNLPACKWKVEIEKHNSKKNTTLSAPKIESFFKSLKQSMFLDEEKNKINSFVEDILREAVKAKQDLENIFKEEFKTELVPIVDELLKKIPLSNDKLAEIRSSYENEEPVVTLLKTLECVQEDSIKNDIKRMLDRGSLSSGFAKNVLTKIVFQRNSILTTSTLSDEIYKKLENFLTKKITFLLNRVKILKDILIDDDEEIKVTSQWGRSEAIKYHLKFLMRQRYMREKTVCAALEMADFDCVNIFHKTLPQDRDKERTDSDNSLASLYEKSSNLFAGFDLRDLLSHRNNIPEAIGEVLDKDDFPSEMIEKVLKLINDSDAIEAVLKLFKTSGIIEKKTFVNVIKNSDKKFENITGCGRWEKYLSLLPLVED